MAIYSADTELGVTAGVGLVTGFAAYIENADGTAPSDSLTDITSASTGNRAQLTTNTGSLTARNLNYHPQTHPTPVSYTHLTLPTTPYV